MSGVFDPSTDYFLLARRSRAGAIPPRDRMRRRREACRLPATPYPSICERGRLSTRAPSLLDPLRNLVNERRHQHLPLRGRLAARRVDVADADRGRMIDARRAVVDGVLNSALKEDDLVIGRREGI